MMIWMILKLGVINPNYRYKVIYAYFSKCLDSIFYFTKRFFKWDLKSLLINLFFQEFLPLDFSCPDLEELRDRINLIRS